MSYLHFPKVPHLGQLSLCHTGPCPSRWYDMARAQERGLGGHPTHPEPPGHQFYDQQCVENEEQTIKREGGGAPQRPLRPTIHLCLSASVSFSHSGDSCQNTRIRTQHVSFSQNTTEAEKIASHNPSCHGARCKKRSSDLSRNRSTVWHLSLPFWHTNGQPTPGLCVSNHSSTIQPRQLGSLPEKSRSFLQWQIN